MRKLIQGSRMLKHPFESLHEDNGEGKMKKKLCVLLLSN